MFTRFRDKIGREEGFTLIELLVVIIIIGILAAIAIPVFLNQREKAWQKSVDSDVRNAVVQMEGYFSDHPTEGYAVAAGDKVAFEATVVVSTGNALRIYGTPTTYCIMGARGAGFNEQPAYVTATSGGVVEETGVAAPCAVALNLVATK